MSDRTDTNNNNGSKIRLESRLTRLEVIVEEIKSQVTNHIPTSIKELRDNQISFINKQDSRVNKIYVAVILLLIGVVINLIVQYAVN